MPDTSPRAAAADPVATELAWIESCHQQIPDPAGIPGPGICSSDRHKWPCHAVTLLAVAKVAAAQHRRSMFPASGPGADDAHGKHYCTGACAWSIDHSTVYRVWPCQPYQDLHQALLGQEAPRG